MVSAARRQIGGGCAPIKKIYCGGANKLSASAARPAQGSTLGGRKNLLMTFLGKNFRFNAENF